jgi:hypothetical protein
MFDWIRKLFGRGKKEEAKMEENKVEFTALKAEELPEETEMPSSRYTEEYAEFQREQLGEETAVRTSEPEVIPEEEETLEEEMLADPFADVAAQDADVELPEPEAADSSRNAYGDRRCRLCELRKSDDRSTSQKAGADWTLCIHGYCAKAG